MNSMVHGKRIVTFVYRNHKNEIANREVEPLELMWGESEYHKGEQWLLRGYCLSRKGPREFAVKNILTPIRPIK